ncbi:MAG: alpha/beta fold hydrolase [Pseudomonadota bacterium]
MREEFDGGVFLRRCGPASAPKIICVHGFADDGAAFAGLAKTALTARFELVAPDLPGFGASDPFADDVATITALADYVVEFAARISPTRPVALIGHSIGSAIAVDAALRRPGVIAHVMSIEGNLTADDAYFSGRAAAYEEPAAFKRDFVADVERMAANESALRRYLEAARRADAASMWRLGRDAAAKGRDDGFGEALLSLASRGVSSLYLWGRRNAPAATARFVDERLAPSSVRVREYGQSGHWKMIDAPEDTARLAAEAFAPLAA